MRSIALCSKLVASLGALLHYDLGMPCVFLASVYEYHVSIFLEAPDPEFTVADSSPKIDDSGLFHRWQYKSIYDVVLLYLLEVWIP